MTKYPTIILKPDREIHLKNHHHAIYKNAVESLTGIETGEIVEVKSSKGEFLCYATMNTRAYICGRAISFEEGDPMATLEKNIKRAVKIRETFFQSEDTDSYRLINAEGDEIPGLIVDKYGPILVVQLTTLGMDRLRTWIANLLMEVCEPKAIFEKSTGAARKKEGLEPKEGLLKSTGPDRIKIKERGLTYLIDLVGTRSLAEAGSTLREKNATEHAREYPTAKAGQKTGLFLDQREMRSLVKQFAAGRTVLDCCSYVGGFSLSALAGGATSADAVDYDAPALERAKEHMAINGIAADQFKTYPMDVFDFLRQRPLPHAYDFIIVDPPAFAKRSSDLDQAKGAYTDLNRLAFQALTPGGLLLTCSCSYQVDSALFQTIVFHAARQAKRNVRILQRHRHAFDHPVNLYHPEVDYLKSLLLWVE